MIHMRGFVIALFVFALAACGGGGSSGGSFVGSPAQSTPSGNIAQESVQRTDAQSALAGVQAFQEYEGGGSVSTLDARRALYVLLKKVTAPMLAPRGAPHAFACEDGLEESSVDNSNGSVTITIEDFYDVACTQPQAEIVWTATETQSGSQTVISGPASFSAYAEGNPTTPTETASVQITFYETDSELTGFSYLLSDIVQNGTPVSGEAGLACNAASSSSTACGIAAVANVAALDAEDGASVNATISTASSLTVNMSIAAYQGVENALSIAQSTFPAWTISPAADLTDSVTISGSASASGFTLTLTDSTYGGTFAITGSSSGTVTGTLTDNANGATEATFTIDSSGNGTLTYANDTTVSVVDYTVQG